jgi:HKD family nuclease
MDIQHISGNNIAKTLVRLMKAHQEFYWAVAWGSDNPALADLLRYTDKIAKLVIGTHFYQTPPAFLEKFKDIEAVRAMAPNGATFHPKIYLFISPKRSALVIGSANFTNSAMGGNVEVCCLIEGATSEKLFVDMRSFVTAECWKGAAVIDADFLRAYRIQHAANKAARASLEKFVPLKRRRPTARGDDPIEMSWAEFAGKVCNEEHFQERLKVLAKARVILDSADSFSQLNQNDRKAIAGTLGEKERKSSGLDWGLFGSMFGFGVLKNKINDNAREISDALDCIPPMGVVTRDNYEGFVEHYLRAFNGLPRVGGIASASRLLAMKRPDCFVCIDNQNKEGLSAHVGLAASAVNLKNYWQDLIEPIWSSPWWQAPRPRGVEGRIWDGRAAFLDALFYRPQQA